MLAARLATVRLRDSRDGRPGPGVTVIPSKASTGSNSAGRAEMPVARMVTRKETRVAFMLKIGKR